MVVFLVKCQKSAVFPASQYDDRLSGGSETIFDATSHAFSGMFSGLSARDEHIHELGDLTFSQSFVTEPAPIHGGLGPLYNNTACINCHHNDGIGLPTAGDLQSSLLMRISMPGTNQYGNPLPVPGYGNQLQDKAIFGTQPECKININYSYEAFTSRMVNLMNYGRPTYTLSDLYTPILTTYMLSPRLAPPMFGLGLLESVPESEIVGFADPNDSNNDGISGHPNYVFDTTTRVVMLGRFGWKANTASIQTQVAIAFGQDMGVTNSIVPVENSYGQPQYDNRHDDPEVQTV